MHRYLLLAAIFGISYAHATSVVIKLTQERIDSAGIVHEDQCKVLSVGKGAFAAASISSFSPTLPSPSNWDSMAAARSAYAASNEDVEAAANDWQARAEQYFGRLADPDRRRARSLVSSDPDHVLVEGVFVGWNSHGNAELIIEAVRFEEADLLRVQHLDQTLRPRDLPYTTNPITQELIEKNSKRGEAARADWRTQSKNLQPSDRDWRSLEFFIVRTSEWAKVGKGVDVLELDRDGHSRWFQNLTCRP
jgi:hypothetical protein